jgi:FKBP-type peptidyl-prolyl cis-trans isomerase SlyD
VSELIPIAENKVVEFAYVLKNSVGTILDQGDKENPLLYLHGGGQIIPGLEKEMLGLKVGDRKSVEVLPKDGYGEVKAELKLQVPRSEFPSDVDLKPGMTFQAENPEGGVALFQVEGVTVDTVYINGNHPLAGEKLFFDVEIVSVRNATLEEIKHGHAHGPGGHDHH